MPTNYVHELCPRTMPTNMQCMTIKLGSTRAHIYSRTDMSNEFQTPDKRGRDGESDDHEDDLSPHLSGTPVQSKRARGPNREWAYLGQYPSKEDAIASVKTMPILWNLQNDSIFGANRCRWRRY